MPKKYQTFEERIIANTVVLDGIGFHLPTGEWSSCWVYLGHTIVNRDGKRYGTISFRYKKGKNRGKTYKELVHRAVIKRLKGRKMSIRQVGMHLCNNTMCCHPNHLVGGSQKKNIKQAICEGRHNGNKKVDK